MFSSRHSVLLLVLFVFATLTSQAQNSSSSAPPEQQPAAQAPAQSPTQSSLSVQARIKARREQRRAAAIHDVYTHLYETYIGAGYLRFHPGDGAREGYGLQRVNEYAWDVGVTRYFDQKLGVTLDGRGTYGTAYVGPNEVTNSAITHPAISQYAVMIGPTYRFILQPKYSVSGRVLAGAAYGSFSSDTGSFTPASLGLYPDGVGFAVNASIPIEYNLTPEVGLRAAPEYFLTNFGSTIQNNLGVTGSIVIRWGKQ
jgi:hypothetical protein